LFTAYPQYVVNYQTEVRERIRQEEQDAIQKVSYLQDLRDKLNRLEDQEEQFARQVEALAATEADRRAALRIEEEIRDMEQAKLAKASREQRLSHIDRIERTVAGSLKSQLDLRQQELRGLEEEIAKRSATDRIRIQGQLEEEGLAALELQASHRLTELMRLRTNEESMRRLKVESNSWAKEQELKERVVREQWKTEDEERRLKVELMQEYKQRALVEAAEAADRAEVSTKQKIAELERELQFQEASRERRLRQLAEDELVREAERRAQLAQKEEELRREEQFLLDRLKTEEAQSQEARLRERTLRLERERRESEAELAAEREAMHKRALSHRKYELEAQLEDIKEKHKAKVTEEERLYQAELHRIDKDRQRRRQMQLELTFKDDELREKTAFQHVLKETEANVMREQRIVTAREREARRREDEASRPLPSVKTALNPSRRSNTEEFKQTMSHRTQDSGSDYGQRSLDQTSSRSARSAKREAEDILSRHEGYRQQAIEELSPDEHSCSSCERSLNCSHSSCSDYSDASLPHSRPDSDYSSAFSSEVSSPPFRMRDSYTSDSVLSESDVSPGRVYSRRTAML
jgi:hypothetical protein